MASVAYALHEVSPAPFGRGLENSGSNVRTFPFIAPGERGTAGGDHSERAEFPEIVGSSGALCSLLENIRIVAPTASTVLVEGETGTGKELIARAIHAASDRRHRPFVKVNCAAIPSELLESELFGHQRGAFTGAVAQRIGRFEAAHEGTIFLDEIGEIPLALQAKLLRAVQEQEFERIGGSRTIRVDVRIVAATNRDLKAMVDEGKFRADLYYRLAVFPVNVPPLRERREDIPMLARHFVQKHARRMNRYIENIPADALESLINCDWPGNIRELQNVIERSVVLSTGSELHVCLPEPAARPAPVVMRGRAPNVSEVPERGQILQALKEANGMVGGANGAAARLGLKRTTLQFRMRKYHISRLYQ
jgi:formate hydrogenlyase transcriptional activator